MADDKLERRGLNSDRWAELVGYFTALKFDMSAGPGKPVEIKLDVPIEVNGWVYMPAVYFPAD